MKSLTKIMLFALSFCAIFAMAAAEEASAGGKVVDSYLVENEDLWRAQNSEVLLNDAAEKLCQRLENTTYVYPDEDLLASIPNIPEWDRCCRACIQEFRCLSWIHDSNTLSCTMLREGGLEEKEAIGISCGTLLI